eukprot:TRINITY_DN187_c0_g1_i2.p1 TRINITY_DN187_c0_g1~~TRINITY_DN187_c0_g1_i2.p1  ORF type:complete len:325 (+),score=108.39 TRINITY_DN187_c0_g1_i2:45-977(+)
MGCFAGLAQFYEPGSGTRKRSIRAIISLTVIFLTVLVITLLALSTNKKVANDQYGVVYDNIMQEFRLPVLVQTITTIPPQCVLILLPRTLQDVDVDDIICFSRDKIKITLTVAVQYQLIQDDLISIIMKQYNGNPNFESVLQHVVTSVIITRCGQYNAEDFYVIRGAIDLDMYQALVGSVNGTYGANIQYFQLVNIGFPTGFSNAIAQKQIVIQNATTVLNQRQSLIIRAQTGLLQAQKTADISIINANNTARITLDQAQASADVVATQWQKRASSYVTAMNQLNLNESQFIEYLKSEILRTSPNLVVNL